MAPLGVRSQPRCDRVANSGREKHIFSPSNKESLSKRGLKYSVFNKFCKMFATNFTDSPSSSVYCSTFFVGVYQLLTSFILFWDENKATCFSYSGSKKLQDLSWDGSHVPQQWRNPVVKELVASDIPKIRWINLPVIYYSQHHVTTIWNKALEMCSAIKKQPVASTKNRYIHNG